MMFSVCLSFSLQRKQQDREAAFAADQALIAESRRIMDQREQQRRDEMQRRADKIQVRLRPCPEHTGSSHVHRILYTLMVDDG